MARIGQRGQSAVELAIVLPVLLLLLLGMADFGRMVSAVLTMQHAVREGLRSGLTGADDADIAARVQQMAPNLDSARLSVAVVPPAAARVGGTDLEVRATYRFPVITPLVAELVGGQLDLEARLVGRVE